MLETLPDGIVAEALADRLRRVPAVDELRASRPQLFSREHRQLFTKAGAVRPLVLKRDDSIAGGRDNEAGSSNIEPRAGDVETVIDTTPQRKSGPRWLKPDPRGEPCGADLPGLLKRPQPLEVVASRT